MKPIHGPVMSRPYSTGIVFEDTSACGSGAHDDIGQQANGTGVLASAAFLMLAAQGSHVTHARCSAGQGLPANSGLTHETMGRGHSEAEESMDEVQETGGNPTSGKWCTAWRP